MTSAVSGVSAVRTVGLAADAPVSAALPDRYQGATPARPLIEQAKRALRDGLDKRGEVKVTLDLGDRVVSGWVVKATYYVKTENIVYTLRNEAGEEVVVDPPLVAGSLVSVAQANQKPIPPALP